MVINRLLGGGVAYVDPVGGKVADEEFAKRVHREFVPFVRDVIDNIYVQGFACFVVDARNGTPHVVPPNACQYAVKMSGRNFKRSMTMTRTGKDVPERRAMFVVDNFPDTNGVPHSAMSSFRRTHAFRGMVEVNTSIADYSAARPMIYTSMDSDKAFDRRHVYRNALDASIEASGLVMGAEPGCDTSVVEVHQRAHDLLLGLNASNHAAHDRSSQNAGRQQQQLANDLNHGLLDPRSVRLDPSTGLPVFDSSMLQQPGDAYNIMPLPIDAKVQATATPHSRPDLVNIIENAATTACVVMGVPGSEIGLSTGRRLAVDAELSEGVLQNTLAKFKYICSRCGACCPPTPPPPCQSKIVLVLVLYWCWYWCRHLYKNAGASSTCIRLSTAKSRDSTSSFRRTSTRR